MRNAPLEKLTWVLIFGGLLTASLGAFVDDRGAVIGWVLMLGGGLAAVVGAVMIFVRSRRPD
jgi:hypothetical protein